MTKISIAPRGADLGAVTSATRAEAEILSIGGYVAQVWVWRGGEAVLVREWSPLGSERWCALVRRGLSAGRVERVPGAGSIAVALRSLGVDYRIRSCRRSPAPPTTSMLRRLPLLRAAHGRGNTWRTLHAAPARAA